MPAKKSAMRWAMRGPRTSRPPPASARRQGMRRLPAGGRVRAVSRGQGRSPACSQSWRALAAPSAAASRAAAAYC
jgi:hypothetical protein